MDLPDLAKLNLSLEEWQANLRAAQQEIADPSVRQQMEAFAEQIRQGQAQLASELPQALQGLQQDLDTAKASAQKTKQTAAEARAKAQQAAPEAPDPFSIPKREPAAIDPRLGMRLRAELLKRLRQGSHEGDADLDREIWEDWDT